MPVYDASRNVIVNDRILAIATYLMPNGSRGPRKQ